MSQIEAVIRQQQAIIQHLGGKVAQLEQLYQQGFIGSQGGLREALEKIAQATAYNAEVLKAYRALATNQGAVYGEQIPGKREPKWLLSNLIVPAGSVTPVTDTVPIPSTGPFEGAQIMGTVRANVPVAVIDGAVVSQVRWRSHNSAISDPLASPNPAAATQPSYTPDITYNGAFDFLWEYSSGKTSRIRMTAPVPSVFLFSSDRPFYLATGDMFDASDAWLTQVTPLFPSFAWLGGMAPTPDVADVAQPYTVTLCMHGVLYAQAPDYKV